MLGWGLAVLLGGLLVAGAAGYFALKNYLHGEGFRKFLAAKVGDATGLEGSGPLSAVQARVELILQLLVSRAASDSTPAG